MEVHKYFLLKKAVPSNKEVQKYFRWKYLSWAKYLEFEKKLTKGKQARKLQATLARNYRSLTGLLTDGGEV